MNQLLCFECPDCGATSHIEPTTWQDLVPGNQSNDSPWLTFDVYRCLECNHEEKKVAYEQLPDPTYYDFDEIPY